MTRKINIEEKEYKKSKKALETLKEVKKDLNEASKIIWKAKNKVKNR